MKITPFNATVSPQEAFQSENPEDVIKRLSGKRFVRIIKRSIDARKKSRILKVYTVEFSCPDEAGLVARVASNRLEKSPGKR